MTLFREIPDATVILNQKGIYRQTSVVRGPGETVFAKYGNGYIRLKPHNATSLDKVTWMELTPVEIFGVEGCFMVHLNFSAEAA